jgi:fucose permease
MHGFWLGFPYVLIATALALSLAAAFVRLPRPPIPAAAAAPSRHPVRTPAFWLFIAIGVLYSIAEGLFGNWAVVFLHEDRGLNEADAGAALSAFWGALVAGRLAISALIVRVPADRVWQALPIFMIGAYLLMPRVDTPTGALATLAFAGIACSAFFPLAVARAVRMYPDWGAFLSSLLVAALMIGVGIGSYTVGPLRDLYGLASLYQWSALFPLIVFALVLVLRAQRGDGAFAAAEAASHGRA